MHYLFKVTWVKENNKIYIKIPFNVWETCELKGLIPVRVDIQGISFECKLVPKGNGMYYIPVKKEIYKTLNCSDEMDVQFEVIRMLSRINSNSPYSKEKPIRKIDSIRYVHQTKNGLCGQTCLAMLTGISVEEVIRIMKSRSWQGSISKVMEALEYFGFTFQKMIYTRGKSVELPNCCIVNASGHLMIYYESQYYDPTHGVLEKYPHEKITSYLEIII